MASITITSRLSRAEMARLRRAIQRRSERLDESISLSEGTIVVSPLEVADADFTPDDDREYAFRVASDLMKAIGRPFEVEIDVGDC